MPVSATDHSVDTDSGQTRSGLDNRHLVRQMLVQKLYEAYYHRQSSHSLQVHQLTAAEDLELEKPTPKIIKKLEKQLEEVENIVAEILTHTEKLDKIILELAPTWPLAQVNSVDLQILRLSIYEGFITRSVPAKVAIDEAIELARDFGTESNIKFVSGVLGNLYANQEKYLS